MVAPLLVRGDRTHAAILTGLLAGACTPTIVEYEPRVHVVQSGETLQMIAWRHGIDTRDLARWNRLQNPDLIFVGQRLSLRPAGPVRPVPRRASPAQPPPPPLPPPPALPAPAWLWPVKGPLVGAYGSGTGTGNGIGIGGVIGQEIRAAAPGRVVYAGDGLVGYGQLLIIKHNDTYLSAYGHNERLVVAEGDTVERGQIIARMGRGPNRRPQLHFEIRRNGTPVDPLSHLPR